MKNRRSECDPALRPRERPGERGSSLIETLCAILILTIGVTGIMSLLAFSITQNWNQGDRATRTTEYAEDKMEQLLALNFSDGSSNTVVYPTQISGGTGLGGTMTGNGTVGGVILGSPVSQYVDYIDSSGNLSSSSTGALFIRQWSISTNAAANLKTITVSVRGAFSLANAPLPATTLVCMKSQ